MDQWRRTYKANGLFSIQGPHMKFCPLFFPQQKSTTKSRNLVYRHLTYLQITFLYIIFPFFWPYIMSQLVGRSSPWSLLEPQQNSFVMASADCKLVCSLGLSHIKQTSSVFWSNPLHLPQVSVRWHMPQNWWLLFSPHVNQNCPLHASESYLTCWGTSSELLACVICVLLLHRLSFCSGSKRWIHVSAPFTIRATKSSPSAYIMPATPSSDLCVLVAADMQQLMNALLA
jgi:hypothetical protein